MELTENDRANLRRQLLELEAIQAIYSGEEETDVNTNALAAVRFAVETGRWPNESGESRLSFTIHLRESSTDQIAANVAFDLPLKYPSVPLLATVSCSSIRGEAMQTIKTAVESAVASSDKSECVMQCVLAAQETLRLVANSEISEHLGRNRPTNNVGDGEVTTESPPSQLPDRQCPNPVLGRRICYSHHILNPTKRKLIVQWAVELHLGGFSKFGRPGIICCEGSDDACKEFVQRLKRLRWKHFVVRLWLAFSSQTTK
eukprot:GHVT01088668.1.p1 GENE.GHVT01088668.1~~GHVT01088668.1.p1  ORF type:complete len:259 (-),score=5.20 GHVT01088668.1:747-1523(-)